MSFEAMEFRANIIFSIIAHASLVVMSLALAGRNVGLSRLPQNYIAVSLLEDTGEKKSLQGEKLMENDQYKPGKPVMKSPELFPPDRERAIVPRNEEVVPPQYPNNDMLQEKASKEVQDSDTNSGQAPAKAHEKASHEDRAAGLGKAPGDDHPAAPLSAQGNGMEIRMSGPRPAGGGDGPRSLIDQIRAAIEKAKRYPVFAKERGQKGVVLIEFSINEKGRPENIRVLKSSGFNLLDAAARDTIIRAAPFPAVKGSIDVPIAFILNKGPSGAH